jgi:hypothetical protein
MMDCCDAADLATALFLREALSNRKPVEVSTVCQWCEEQPSEILPNGVRSKYCARCTPEALGAAA